ncbi:MAG: SPASM domain-containing protein [Candidatus Tectomicrobia bacterium]|nr:SPASM domain-containing protein [Candidatus Tectomicrobia bacterium]
MNIIAEYGRRGRLAVWWMKVRRFTIPRVLNLFLETIATWFGSSRVPHLPSNLTLDIGNICDLRCPLCPTGIGDRSASKGVMGLAQFRQIIDEVGGRVLTVNLHNWGEPLLNKHLVAMIAYAKSYGLEVRISSNLNALTEPVAEGLLRAGLDKLYVSCDGITPESYAQYRRGGDYATVMGNLRGLLQKKRELGLRGTRIIWLFHIFQHNEHEVEGARALAKELGVELRLNRMRTAMGREIFESAAQAIARDGAWIPRNPAYSAFDTASGTARRPMSRCRKPWREAMVNWDGSVLPCCAIYSERHTYGNALEEGFRRVWNNERYQAARRTLRNQPARQATVCATCKRNGYLFM